MRRRRIRTRLRRASLTSPTILTCRDNRLRSEKPAFWASVRRYHRRSRNETLPAPAGWLDGEQTAWRVHGDSHRNLPRLCGGAPAGEIPEIRSRAEMAGRAFSTVVVSLCAGGALVRRRRIRTRLRRASLTSPTILPETHDRNVMRFFVFAGSVVGRTGASAHWTRPRAGWPSWCHAPTLWVH